MDDAGATHDRVRGRGAAALAPPRAVEWAEKMTLLGDPAGYVVEAARPSE